MWYRDFYPRSRPRATKGGIKAQSKRGQFGQSWWAKRWIGVLERFDIGARLGRGRSYARNGQVLSIDIDKGVVKATVQGSRPKPYAITINLKPLSSGDWKKVAKVLAGNALFAAKLLAGEMPQDIETAFKNAGVSLFPARSQDLETKCSCPDWSNPCKHIAAVYYLIGEEFDRDPFLIFKLRGITREELVGNLGSAPKSPAAATTIASFEPEPLCADAATFWSGKALPEDFIGPVEPPRDSAALPKRLGNFPFWRGEQPFLEAMAHIYGAAAERGFKVVIGAECESQLLNKTSALPPLADVL
jgi:uncharacterized Zn finger protein